MACAALWRFVRDESESKSELTRAGQKILGWLWKLCSRKSARDCTSMSWASRTMSLVDRVCITISQHRGIKAGLESYAYSSTVHSRTMSCIVMPYAYRSRRYSMLLPWRCKTPTNTLSPITCMKSHLSICGESSTNSPTLIITTFTTTITKRRKDAW